LCNVDYKFTNVAYDKQNDIEYWNSNSIDISLFSS